MKFVGIPLLAIAAAFTPGLAGAGTADELIPTAAWRFEFGHPTQAPRPSGALSLSARAADTGLLVALTSVRVSPVAMETSIGGVPVARHLIVNQAPAPPAEGPPMDIGPPPEESHSVLWWTAAGVAAAAGGIALSMSNYGSGDDYGHSQCGSSGNCSANCVGSNCSGPLCSDPGSPTCAASSGFLARGYAVVIETPDAVASPEIGAGGMGDLVEQR